MSRWSTTRGYRFPQQFAAIFLLLAICAMQSLLVNNANATSTSQEFKLDVPFVPTPHSVVAEMLSLADVKESDFLIDLGAGDGRIAVAAVRDRGAKGAFGVDINPVRVTEARELAEEAGVADRVSFEVQDLFETDFSNATVVSMYLLPTVNLQLRPKILDLRPGTRIVSHAFTMGDWEPDARSVADGLEIFYWVVPENIEGRWLFVGRDGDFTADLSQTFQKVSGRATGENNASFSLRGKLEGDVVHLYISQDGQTPQRYTGRVEGNTIVALAENGSVLGWQATKREGL